jgi:nucleoside-diphosphate-sugar epimerase
MACSIEAARRDLGYEPRVPLTEGLRRRVDWYRGRQGAVT